MSQLRLAAARLPYPPHTHTHPTGSRDWRRPDKTLRPAGTVALEGGVACETDFYDCGEDAECDVEIAGAKVPLQRVSISLPPDVPDVGGLTFVLRRCGWESGMGGRGRSAGWGWEGAGGVMGCVCGGGGRRGRGRLSVNLITWAGLVTATGLFRSGRVVQCSPWCCGPSYSARE